MDFDREHPDEGYRCLTYMMIDAGVVAASPGSVYRVLKQAKLLNRWAQTPSTKGQGFRQPEKPHEHWHIDVAYVNICGTFYDLCSLLDGCSRYLVHGQSQWLPGRAVESGSSWLKMPALVSCWEGAVLRFPLNQYSVHPTRLIGVPIQVSYSLCGFSGSDVEGHEPARQLAQTVERRNVKRMLQTPWECDISFYPNAYRKGPMKTIHLGKTGVEVSALCLGVLYFGNRIGKEMSYHLMDRYVDVGGSFFDTANIYSCWIPGFQGGESEIVLGQWMRDRKNRSQLFIASKLGFPYQNVAHGLRADQIQTECEKSLQRLQTDVIDLYYAHVDDRDTPLEETMEAFDRLIRAGKVRYIGASNFLAWRLEKTRMVSRANGWAEYCCIQQRYSYLRPKPGATFGEQVCVNGDLLDYVQSESISLLAYSPLLNGAYTRADRDFPEQYLGPDTDTREATLRAVAEEIDATVNQIVYAWMVHSDPPVIPLMAASTDAQIEENLGALSVKLSDAQMSRLNSASG